MQLTCDHPGPPRRARHGFTLIEIMVVLAIIGTLGMLVGPSVFRHVSDARVTAARTQIEAFALALEAFQADIGRYPTTEEGLPALRATPMHVQGWRGPYLRKEIPLDPWRAPYNYASPGTVNVESYDLYSLGKDGTPGGEDEAADVTSWGGQLGAQQ